MFDPAIAEREIQVWSLSLSVSSEAGEEFGRVLSADERERVARFRLPQLKERFTAAHGALRHLLGAYLGQSPGTIRFEYGAQGKPRIDSPLCFNMSHSDDRLVVAIAHGADIGIDIERCRANEQMEQIARDYFSPEEAGHVLSAPPAQRPRTFLSVWTRKEAFTKAVGCGLGCALTSFSISPLAHEPAPVVRLDESARHEEKWMTRGILKDPDYVAGLAYHEPAVIRCHEQTISAETLLCLNKA